MITVQGKDNKLILRPYEGENRLQPLPILIGFTHPEHGEAMSPYSEAPCINLHLINETTMPIIIGEKAKNCIVETKENKYTGNVIVK
ncbi:MAG: hypothetical protein LBU22_01500 [Dysgonamonadaceae bacterium]|nr:hypothetical protein [Dysgonamonadaceae bacterium]